MTDILMLTMKDEKERKISLLMEGFDIEYNDVPTHIKDAFAAFCEFVFGINDKEE